MDPVSLWDGRGIRSLKATMWKTFHIVIVHQGLGRAPGSVPVGRLRGSDRTHAVRAEGLGQHPDAGLGAAGGLDSDALFQHKFGR